MTSQLERISIDSLCVNVTSGGTPLRTNPKFWEDGNIPWYKTAELKDWYVEEAEERITEEGLAGSAAKFFPPNTVLMAMYGDGRTITSLGILRDEATTNQACCAMIADSNKCNFLYLFYALKHHRREILQLVIAGAQRNLSIGIIRNFEIINHPLHIQNKIAAILSPYDNLIENNRRRIELLELSAQLLYREWFVSLYFPGHEHVKVKDGVPQGWERLPLGDVLTLQRGFDLPTLKRIEGDVPIYASTGINGYHNKAMVSAPGVVTGRSGSLGTVMYVVDDFWPLNTALWVKEFKRVTPVFAYHLLSGLHLEQYNGGAAVPTLNRNDVHRIEVLCPPQKLIDNFTDYVLSTYEQVKLLTQSNKKLQQARDLLLPRLMNGEIVV